MPLVIRKYQKTSAMTASRAFIAIKRGLKLRGYDPVFVELGSNNPEYAATLREAGTPVIFYKIVDSIWNNVDTIPVPYIEFLNGTEAGKYACITRPYLDRVREKFPKVMRLLSNECRRQLEAKKPVPEPSGVEEDSSIGS